MRSIQDRTPNARMIFRSVLRPFTEQAGPGWPAGRGCALVRVLKTVLEDGLRSSSNTDLPKFNETSSHVLGRLEKQLELLQEADEPTLQVWESAIRSRRLRR